MSRVPLMIQLALEQSELGMFDGADIMVNPHLPAERVMFLECMATVEQAVEATGNAEAIRAFQWLGGFLARAKYTRGAPLNRPGSARRFDA